MCTPLHLADEAFRALRGGDLHTYHRLVRDRKEIDFSNSDLRGTDLRQVDLSLFNLQGAYLKDCDLRGLDLRHLNLEGASLHNAKIGGVYFPLNIPVEEILMSVSKGTRIRIQE